MHINEIILNSCPDSSGSESPARGQPSPWPSLVSPGRPNKTLSYFSLWPLVDTHCPHRASSFTARVLSCCFDRTSQYTEDGWGTICPSMLCGAPAASSHPRHTTYTQNLAKYFVKQLLQFSLPRAQTLPPCRQLGAGKWGRGQVPIIFTSPPGDIPTKIFYKTLIPQPSLR